MTAGWPLLKLRLERQFLELLVVVYSFIVTFLLMHQPACTVINVTPSSVLHQSLYQLSEIKITPETQGEITP